MKARLLFFLAAWAALRAVSPAGPEACGLYAADAPVPVTDPDLLAAYAAGDKIVTRMKTAEAEIPALRADISALRADIATLRAQLQAAETAAAAALQARDTAIADRDAALQKITTARAALGL